LHEFDGDAKIISAALKAKVIGVEAKPKAIKLASRLLNAKAWS